MSEQQTTEIDYAAPIGQPNRVGNYEEMTPGNPMPKEDLPDEVFGSNETGIEKAANEVAARREETREERQAKKPLQREYQQQAGERRGEPSPVHHTLSPEQAAFELSAARQGEQALELDEATRQTIQQMEADAMAAEVQAALDKPPPQEAPQPQQSEQQPAEPQPALEGDNVWQDPRVIAGVTEYTNQVAGAFQQAEAKYAADLAANAAAATASIFATVPELQGLQTTEQLQTALGIIERQNPERGQQIRAHISNVQQLSAKAQEVQQQQALAQAQQYRQQFDHVAKQADDAYDKWITAQEPDAGRRQEITATALQMLRDSGLSDRDITYHWQSSPILRSFAGQQIMADAARYRMAHQAAKTKAVRPVPTVQRPGSGSFERASDSEYALRDLNQKLNSSHSVKDAAALLQARRSGRR